MVARYKTVVEAGADAPWLVMVHGMSHDHRLFSEQVDAFKDRYRIQLIDLPGHGLSGDIPGPFGHVELAAHVAGAMDAAGVSHCHYWGNHTGTALGLLLLCDNADRFRSLVLEGPVLPGQVPPSAAAALQQARDIAQADGVPAAVRRWFEDGEWFDVIRERPQECRADAHWAMVSQFSGAPWLYNGDAKAVAPIDDRLPSLDVPILLYNGEHDLQEFLRIATRLEALAPRAKRATIPGAGGFPAWEFPGYVNRLVGDYLAQVTADPK